MNTVSFNTVASAAGRTLRKALVGQPAAYSPSIPAPSASDSFDIRFSSTGDKPKSLLLNAFSVFRRQLPQQLRDSLSGFPREADTSITRIEMGINKPIVIHYGGKERFQSAAVLSTDDFLAVKKSLQDLFAIKEPQSTLLTSYGLQSAGELKGIARSLNEIVQFDNTVVASANESDPEITTRNQQEFAKLLEVLPADLKTALATAKNQYPGIEEIEFDLGRPVRIRLHGKTPRMYIESRPFTLQDAKEINAALLNAGAVIRPKDRMGFPGTLHRLSPIYGGKHGRETIGFTFRVGRALKLNLGHVINKSLSEGNSMLLVGAPGAGKTSILREAARTLGDPKGPNKAVVIVDTSNEIAGDDDALHWSLGDVRRLQVPDIERQHETMLRAVQNHRTETLIIDEIGAYKEAMTASSIARQGIQLLATVHGKSLEDVVKNPELAHLIGNPKAVAVGDQSVGKMSEAGRKNKIERQQDPAFNTMLVMIDRNNGLFYPDLTEAIDEHLMGRGESYNNVIQLKFPNAIS